jgi:hypothetical protein
MLGLLFEANAMTRRHPLLLPLIALLLATRALVPTGWMPTADAGGIHITLCTGQGMVDAVIGPDGKLKQGGAGDQTHHDPCPYGTLGHALDTPSLPELAAAPAPQPEIRTETPVAQIIAALHAPRPPTRGPPALA